MASETSDLIFARYPGKDLAMTPWGQIKNIPWMGIVAITTETGHVTTIWHGPS